MTKKPNQTFEADIDRLGINGEGIGHLNGYTLFIQNALPGERVRARLFKIHKTYGKARLLEVLRPEAKRQTPPCPLFGRCGGCQLMHMPYEAQLRYKQGRLMGDLEKIGGLKDPPVMDCLPAGQTLGYRNKIEAPFRLCGNRPDFGFFAFESHRIVPLDHCPVHCAPGQAVFEKVRALCLGAGLRAYEETRHNRALRHVLIRTAVHTGQCMVVLITNGFNIKGIESLGRKMMESHPAVKGVVQCNNPVPGNVVLGRAFRTLAGSPVITETVHGLSFTISPGSFFQVNTGQLAKLMDTVLDLAELEGNENILDAYCGVGLFSLFLAKRTSGMVTGIESDKDMVKSASENAAANNISNVSFLAGRAEDVVRELAAFDIAVLDPPRKGCDPAFLKDLVKKGPGKIVYVSCNPATLARDLKFLAGAGYALKAVRPVDMFPQTAHVESVVSLRRI